MLGLDLDPDSKIKVKNYSLGMYQKLAIIQAVMEDPNVIIFDEPFNGLDKKSFGIVKQMIVGLKGKGRIVLITSHILSDIQEVADEVYEFDNKQNTPLVC
jgi:ABC-2 type transport system ATP-binding protein